jgi:predicted acylesterase/phospholipase RssA
MADVVGNDSGTRTPHIGVALSGGGHRATLFGLGAMAYLLDAGKGPELSTISSISGGSITNGWLGLESDLTTVRADEVDELTHRLAHRVARQGTLWASPYTYLYLVVLAAVLAAPVVACFIWNGWAVWVSWLVALVLILVIARQRSWLARRAFEKTLFHGRPLTDLHRAVTHVICSTDLQTSEHVYFSSHFVYSWRTGIGKPADLHVADAVQASAALPGAFTPVAIRLAPHQFPKDSGLSSFLLTDGGVYDNMGTEWLLRAAHGFDDDAANAMIGIAPVREVVVVNSSAAKSITNRKLVRVPGLGELVTLLAVKDVMYDQTTALRRRWLDTRYRIAARAGDSLPDLALRGATIQIDRSPYDLADRYARFRDDQGRAAADVIARLDAGDGREYWTAAAVASSGVGTNLSRIPVDQAAGLLRHAYVLTMANCHVLLGYPLLDIPTADRVRGWVS